MTVFDKMTLMASTGFTGTPLIVGNMLNDIMLRVVVNLYTSLAVKADVDFLFEDSEIISGEAYHSLWELIIQPTVVEYLLINRPNAWFLNLYLSKKYFA